MLPLFLPRPHAASAAALLCLLALVTSSAHAQDGAVNVVTPPTSDYVVEGATRSRLELVRDEDARRPTDLQVLTSIGALACHLPCTLDVPSGMVHLVAEGLDQRFELELPVARFRVRAGDPVPWLESIGGILGGAALGVVGTIVVLSTTKEDEIVGGAALITLGVVFFGLSVALLAIGLVEQGGSVELDTFEAALREGVVRF